jgi:hypothetical protein
VPPKFLVMPVEVIFLSHKVKFTTGMSSMEETNLIVYLRKRIMFPEGKRIACVPGLPDRPRDMTILPPLGDVRTITCLA